MKEEIKKPEDFIYKGYKNSFNVVFKYDYNRFPQKNDFVAISLIDNFTDDDKSDDVFKDLQYDSINKPQQGDLITCTKITNIITKPTRIKYEVKSFMGNN